MIKDAKGSWSPRNWSPDRWIALSAMFVSICAVAVSFYEGYSNRLHNRLSVRPNLQISFIVKEKGAGWRLANNGLGPAIITAFQVTVDDKPQPTWRDVIIALKMPVTAGFHFQYINPTKGSVISAGVDI